MKLKTLCFNCTSFDKITKSAESQIKIQQRRLLVKSWKCRESLILQQLINKQLIFCPLEFRLAVVQLHVSKIKADNLGRAQKLVKEAAGQGAKVVVLPVSIIFSILSYMILTSVA